MRKSIIGSKKANKRKERKNQITLGIVIIFLMIFSVLGVALYNPSAQNSIEDFGLDFEIVQVNNQQVAQTRIDGQLVQFFYLPSALDDIPTNFQDPQAVMALGFNANQTDLEFIDYGRYLISEDLAMRGITTVPADVVDCTIPTIVLQYANTTQIYQDNQCTYLEAATTQEVFRVIERYRYGLYEVI